MNEFEDQQAPNFHESVAWQNELKSALNSEDSNIGKVFRADEEELPDSEICQRLGLETISSVNHARRSLRAIFYGIKLPGLGPAQRAVADLKRLLRNHQFSPTTKLVLEERLTELTAHVQRLNDEDTFQSVDEETCDSGSISGVYVWSLSTYMRDEDDRGQVWLRIGCSDNVQQRMSQHRNSVKLPEPIRLLRVYSLSHLRPVDLEQKFHEICRRAVHDQARVLNRDREWFRSNLSFLDQYASDLGCAFHDSITDEEFRRD